jgi:hypothetical protein
MYIISTEIKSKDFQFEQILSNYQKDTVVA